MSSTDVILTQEDIDIGLQSTSDMITKMISTKYAANSDEHTLKDVILRVCNLVRTHGEAHHYEKKDIDTCCTMLEKGYHIPAGSILSGLKSDNTKKTSMSNCYVMKYAHDSIEGIFSALCEMARTYSYRGGCGSDITILRPEGTPVCNAANTSTGAVSFMPLISLMTDTIGQDDGRRGAALISLDVRHPDLMRFIWCKADPERVLYKDPMNKSLLGNQLKQFLPAMRALLSGSQDTQVIDLFEKMASYIENDGSTHTIDGANISVRANDEFMQAVKEDKPWVCYFPDITANKKLYDEKWDGDYDNWKKYGGTLKAYTTYRSVITRDNATRFIGHEYQLADGSFECITESIAEQLADCAPVRMVFKIPSARKILKDIAMASWMRGDPGLLFWDQMCKWSTVYDIHEDLKFRTTNPCFSLDTLIAVADGNGPRTLRSLIEDGNDVPVYTKSDDGSLAVKIGRHPRITGYATTLTRVHFGNGSYQDVTHDHKFELQTGDVKCASDLKVGDILFRLHKEHTDDTVSTVGNTQGHSITETLSHGSCLSENVIIDLPPIQFTYADGTEQHLLQRHCEACGKKYYVVSSSRELAYCSSTCEQQHKEQKLKRHTEQEYIVNHKDSLTLIVTGIENVAYNDDVGTMTVDGTHTLYTMTHMTEGTEDYVLSQNCGELALSWYGNCLLGANVLSSFVKDPWTDHSTFDYKTFEKYCSAAVIFLNIICDVNCSKHPLEKQRNLDAFGRRIGIEFTAFADTLSMLNLQYGDNPDTLSFIEKIMHLKAIVEIETSLKLAKQQSACDAFDEKINPGSRQRFIEQPYVRFLLDPTYYNFTNDHACFLKSLGFTEDRLSNLTKDILKYGLRNVGFNCVGPTGSISILQNNCSSGIEPIFALSYKRRTRIGTKLEYTMCHTPLLHHLKQASVTGSLNLTDLKKQYHIVEAHELDYKQRIAVQSAVQKYHDGSISSTINLPMNCTPEDILQIYLHAWQQKLKGITVYRAGSLDGVLLASTPKVVTPTASTTSAKVLQRGELIQLPKQRPSITHEVMWNGTKMYAVVSMDDKGNPMELFINLPREVSIDKNGVFNEADYQNKMSMWMALTRMISMTLRLGGSVSLCIKQMTKASFAINDPMSIITRVLYHYDGSYGAKEATEHLTVAELEASELTRKCPKCGAKSYVREAGCSICKLCLFTKCD